MNNSIILQNVSQQDLQTLIETGVATHINALKKDLISDKAIDELMTRRQTCEFLRIDSSTLWSWTNKGKVRAYAIAHRRYYKRSELIQALKPVLKAADFKSTKK